MLSSNQNHTKNKHQKYGAFSLSLESLECLLSVSFGIFGTKICRAIFVGIFGFVVAFGATGCALFQPDKYANQKSTSQENAGEEIDEIKTAIDDEEEEVDISKIEIPKESLNVLPADFKHLESKRFVDSRQIATDASYDGEVELDCPNPKYFPKKTADLKKLIRDKKIPLGEIDTSKITDMKRLFFDAEEDDDDPDVEYLIPLRSNFKGIECWDVSNVRDMSLMFKGMKTFNEPINHWDVSNVEVMIAMFAGAESFNQPLDSWNVSKVRSMKGMFYGTKSFNQPLDMWNIRNVKNMNKMFEKTPAFKQNLDAWGDKLRPDAIMKDMFKDSALQSHPPKWLKK